MIKKLCFAAVGAAMTFITNANPLIPLPAHMEQTSGKDFNFRSTTIMAIPQWEGDSVAKLCRTMLPELDSATGSAFKLDTKGKKGDVSLLRDPSIPAEGYSLSVDSKGVTIKASRPVGFFYGLQTLAQLARGSEATPSRLEPVAIADSPRFGWRGLMLDESRHFYGKDEVKKLLDLMAYYKMNRFHWHLTDDQGWRIEIKKWPLLTEVGAKRACDRLGNDYYKLDPDTISYDGYYTHDDIREIVDYARDRFIEIVPEIDMPGHTQAAVASYPEILACRDSAGYEVWRYQGVSPDIMNVARPEAVTMARDIINEVIDLFPYEYIHLGGDECPVGEWQRNELCQEKLKAIGSEKFRDLQLNFYQELLEGINKDGDPSRNRTLIFWNEVLHGNPELLPQDAVIMSWVDADREGILSASRGHRTIMTPQIPYYINRRQSTDPGEPDTQGSGTETVERVYAYDPFAIVPAELQDKYLGVQANVWTERVPDGPVLEYLIMPRMAAVAEAAWTPQTIRDYESFRERMAAQLPTLDQKGWKYARHIFTETTDKK